MGLLTRRKVPRSEHRVRCVAQQALQGIDPPPGGAASRPRSSEFGPASVGFGPASVFGRFRPKLSNLWMSLAQMWSNLARARPTSPQIWPVLDQIRPDLVKTLVESGPNFLSLGRPQHTNLADSGPKLVDIARIWLTLARHPPRSTTFSTTSAKVGPDSTKSGAISARTCCLANIGPHSQNLHGPHFGTLVEQGNELSAWGGYPRIAATPCAMSTRPLSLCTPRAPPVQIDVMNSNCTTPSAAAPAPPREPPEPPRGHPKFGQLRPPNAQILRTIGATSGEAGYV